MTTSASEIKAAVDLMTAEDIVDGVPKLEVVQRIAGDTTITAEDVAAAMPGPGTGGEPTIIATTGATGGADGAAHTVDPDAAKEDNVDVPVDPNDVKRALAAKAAGELAEVQAQIDSLQVQARNIADALKLVDKQKADLERVIEANTVQFSQAEMVKRIQKQTQDRLARQAEARTKVAAVMSDTGAAVKTFASPLDQALANGAKRSTVLLEGGKVFQAPHPRSPEGVKAYGGWIHNGQKQNA